MEGLRDRGLDDALRERVETGGPTLGICLGPPARARGVGGGRRRPGLGLLPGVRHAPARGRVPRIGWAPVEPGGEAFYFAHSYAAETPADRDVEGVVAVAESGSFLGVQFHPEKSGRRSRASSTRCLSRA